MKKETIYRSADGRSFATIDECRAYERSFYARRLAGLKIASIEAAMAGHDRELAVAIKKVANLMPVKIRAKAPPEGSGQGGDMDAALADPTGDKAAEMLAQKLVERSERDLQAFRERGKPIMGLT